MTEVSISVHRLCKAIVIFPDGVSNPLLNEKVATTADVFEPETVDFGVAFDGDFDSYLVYDDSVQFVPSEYVVGLLEPILFGKVAGAKIVHDPTAIGTLIGQV